MRGPGPCAHALVAKAATSRQLVVVVVVVVERLQAA